MKHDVQNDCASWLPTVQYLILTVLSRQRSGHPEFHSQTTMKINHKDLKDFEGK